MRIGTILLKDSCIFVYLSRKLILFSKDNSGTSILVSLLQRKQNLEGLFSDTDL